MSPNILSRVAQPVVIISATAAVAVIAVAFTLVSLNSKPAFLYISPIQGPITEEVDATGAAKAADTLDLSFQASGRIIRSSATVGAHVMAGAVLASLSSADSSAALEQAQAALAMQQAKLGGLQAGARPESIAVSQATVSAAQTALSQAKNSIVQAAQDAYVKSDDAVHNKVDQFFFNPRTANASLAFNVSDSNLQSSMITGRLSMETLLAGWQSYLAGISSDTDTVNVADIVSKTQNNLSHVSSYLDTVAAGLNSVITNPTYTNAVIQAYETNVATARSAVSADMAALNAAATAEKGAESQLASAQAQLALAQAPATPTDLAAQEAQVAAAQANVDAAQAQLAKIVIVAPISGIITKNDAHVGETSGPSASVISMISDSKFQFESFVSQADVAKIKADDVGHIQLDAFQNQLFPAHVIAVDPAATVQAGISSYKITLEFDDNDPRIQAGLTGTAKVTTQNKDSVLSVPSSAVITRGSDMFVLRSSPSGDQLTKVTIGITGSGTTEITSGLSATDKIRSFGTQ